MFDKLDLFSLQNRVESTATFKNGAWLAEQGMNGFISFGSMQGAGFEITYVLTGFSLVIIILTRFYNLMKRSGNDLQGSL